MPSTPDPLHSPSSAPGSAPSSPLGSGQPTKKVEFFAEMGMHHAAEVHDVPVETTDDELNEMLDVFLSNHLDSGWRVLDGQ